MPVIVQKYQELVDTVSTEEALQPNQIHRANFTWLEDNAVAGNCKYYYIYLFLMQTFSIISLPTYSIQCLVVMASLPATYIVVTWS